MFIKFKQKLIVIYVDKMFIEFKIFELVKKNRIS